MSDVEKKEFSLLPLLTFIIDLHDPYGTSHSQRVAALALRLSKKHGVLLGEEESADLEMAALIHDIGKIAVPEVIRRMPGLFTDAERLVMRGHPENGVELLDKVSEVSISRNIKDIIVAHHENYSGTGYPHRLAGRKIPMGARIIRIVDSYDAITNVRGYAKKRTKTEAIELMVDDQIQDMIYDPDLFRTFLEMMKDVKDDAD